MSLHQLLQRTKPRGGDSTDCPKPGLNPHHHPPTASPGLREGLPAGQVQCWPQAGTSLLTDSALQLLKLGGHAQREEVVVLQEVILLAGNTKEVSCEAAQRGRPKNQLAGGLSQCPQ